MRANKEEEVGGWETGRGEPSSSAGSQLSQTPHPPPHQPSAQSLPSTEPNLKAKSTPNHPTSPTLWRWSLWDCTLWTPSVLTQVICDITIIINALPVFIIRASRSSSWQWHGSLSEMACRPLLDHPHLGQHRLCAAGIYTSLSALSSSWSSSLAHTRGSSSVGYILKEKT